MHVLLLFAVRAKFLPNLNEPAQREHIAYMKMWSMIVKLLLFFVHFEEKKNNKQIAQSEGPLVSAVN